MSSTFWKKDGEKIKKSHRNSINKGLEIPRVYMTNKEKESPYILYEVYHDAKSREPVFRNVIKKNKPLKNGQMLFYRMRKFYCEKIRVWNINL